jgi:argininosuccinate lyase
MAFDPEYISRVLRENFEDAKALFLSPLIAINYAHLVMLRERDIITAADAGALRHALDSISIAEVGGAQYDHACEDLFFHVERKIGFASPEAATTSI